MDHKELSDKEFLEKVNERAGDLLKGETEQDPLDDYFIKDCLDTNERGDGVMYARLLHNKFLFNATAKEEEWFWWAGHVWEKDDFRKAFIAVENCALEYHRMALQLKERIETEEIQDSKKDPEQWVYKLKEKYVNRASRLRSELGARKTLIWASRVDDAKMSCRESDFDCDPWMLPVKNGVINLKTGVLIDGRPEDMLTRCLDIEYDPHAEYEPFLKFLEEVSYDEKVEGSEEIPAFIKRLFGYSCTGHAHEQYLFVFIGPGRNGKGVLFNLIASVLGPYYHEVNRAMILEQRNEPSANAASEHKYSLLGKRFVVGAETNKGQKIDSSAVKSLTGNNKINARQNFGKEIIFKPTHTLFLQTNNLPYGLTGDFSLVQRLVLIEFPNMYVDDVELEKKKFPRQTEKFRKKDPNLEEELMKYRQGILRWLVEGCREWQEEGLNPPECILKHVNKLEQESDSIGNFIKDCLENVPEIPDTRIACTEMYDAFLWWWSENMNPNEKRLTTMKTINKTLRDRGFKVEKVGGRTMIYEMRIKYDVTLLVDAFAQKKRIKS